MRKSLVVLVLVLFIAGCNITTPSDEQAKFEEVNTELITNQEVKQWYEDKKSTLGIHKFEASESIYLLIAAGEKTTGGYNLSIKEAKLEDTTFSGELIFETPDKDDLVTMAFTYPSLLFKFSNLESLEVDIDLAALKKDDKTTTVKQIIAQFNGLIDNNSIEIDTSVSAQLEAYSEQEKTLALRINQEQYPSFDELELSEYIIFDAYQDEDERMVLDQILEIGLSDKKYQISAIYEGRMDSNSIEVKINSAAVAIRYPLEKERQDIGEIEVETPITIDYKFNEFGQRVADKISLKE